MRAPAPLQLALPGRRRRYGGLLVSLLLHALVAVLVIRSGERLWTRTLAPHETAATSQRCKGRIANGK